MAGELPLLSEVKRGEGRGHDEGSERNMGEQHAVVEDAQPTLPAKAGHLRSTVVIDKIADKEGSGKKASAQHEIHVQASLLTSDRDASAQQEEQGGSIEQGIERGKLHRQWG